MRAAAARSSQEVADALGQARAVAKGADAELVLEHGALKQAREEVASDVVRHEDRLVLRQCGTVRRTHPLPHLLRTPFAYWGRWGLRWSRL